MAFSDLKADVESWVVRNDFPASVYTLATEEINRSLRVRQMLSDYSATTTAESISLPSDWIEFEGVYAVSNGSRYPLTATTEFLSAAGHRASGSPLEYTVKDGAIHFNPIPDGTYTLGGQYYAKLADFALDEDTNDVLTNFYSIYLSGCLAFAFGWAQDAENEAKWTQLFISRVEMANKVDLRARFSGPLKPRPQASA